VTKTNKVLVAYEDAQSWGYGAEIAARIADECFPWLDAPVKRVASTDTFVGYAPRLEDFILPQVEDLARAMRDLHVFLRRPSLQSPLFLVRSDGPRIRAPLGPGPLSDVRLHHQVRHDCGVRVH